MMVNYNTFTVVDCKTRKIKLVTSSARKAEAMLRTGARVEVWNSNSKTETIYSNRNRQAMGPYIEAEREYIKKRQAQAEEKNRRLKWRKN